MKFYFIYGYCWNDFLENAFIKYYDSLAMEDTEK